MKLAVSSLLAIACCATPAVAQDFEDTVITAVELRPGVAVLFGAGGNIGVSYGEDGTILIDDQFAPLSDKIMAAVAALGAEPVEYVINTHWHFDHAGGNEPFGEAGALIVAHENVRTRLVAGGTVLGNVTPPAPDAALPVLTYDEGMTIHANGDRIDLIFLGGGHTDGDTIVFWREANVVHMGDNFMNESGWPFIDIDSGGNVEHLLTSLGRVLAMIDEDTVVIPGHGSIADRAGLAGFRAMVVDGVARVRALKEQGLSLEEAVAAAPVAGVANSANGFISDDAFVTAVWQSLEAHAH